MVENKDQVGGVHCNTRLFVCRYNRDMPNKPTSPTKTRYQQRIFLLLEDDTEQMLTARRILKSPLELARDIVTHLFSDDFELLKDDLDSIKKFAAGIDRTERLAKDYATARYYALMFAFHQYFHSSYRARQGKVLEEILKTILREHTHFTEVPDSVKKGMGPLLQKTFRTKNIPKNDIDVLGMNATARKMILIQLRSRDDTGGTTAKGSLVDMLRGLLRLKRIPQDRILYLICIWDERDSQQKKSTIEKVYASLREYTKLDRADFDRIGQGVEIAKNIVLKMAYGTSEILDSIFDWDESHQKTAKNSVSNIVKAVENWDDLWVSYALASLELDTVALKGVSNVKLLNQKFEEQGLSFDFESNAALQKSVDRATQQVLAVWKEDSLPVRSPADQTLYIRDLLFLKAIYQKSYISSKKKDLDKVLTARPRVIHEQPTLYYQPNLIQSDFKPSGSTEPELISFRELVPEIADTTYLTHALYYYPAKFIPQVVRYCVTKYSPENGWIIDPFAGSATVGLEAVLCRRNAILLDLNLLLGHIVPLKMSVKQTDLSKTALSKLLDDMRLSKRRFYPNWSNLEYWYPQEILETLSQYWGWQKQATSGPYTWIVEAALLKASRQFSYTEHKAPKLFKSKSKLANMAALLQTDWRRQLDELIYDTAFDVLKRVRQLAPLLAERDNRIVTHSGVDSAKFQMGDEYELDCLITSPPYLQAQEYIRTSKLELYWLGHSEEEIKKLGKLEIPYFRKADTLIETETLNQVRERLERIDLIALLDSYFCYTLQAIENATSRMRLNGKACIFVGNPKVDGIEVETWRIISEYLTARGFRFEHVFEDRIKNRQLFGGRKNKNPDGMKSEFLLVLSKQS